MKLIKHHDEIWELTNFLYNDEINICLDHIKNIPEDEWINNKNYAASNNEVLKPILSEITKRILTYIENVQEKIGICDIQRLMSGMFISQHQDIDTNEHPQNIIYGGVIYFNNNFSGGELFYPELNYKITPQTGSLVLHKSNYLHEVLPIKDGIRYMATVFAVGDENTECLLK